MLNSQALNTAPRRLSTAWPQFAKQLTAVLKRLREDQCLVISTKESSHFVQFAGQGSFGMRAESVANDYLPQSERFDAHQIAALRDLGWLAPTGTPEESSTPEQDPDGSPNFFLDCPKPVPYATIADLAVRTLAEVMRVPHPRCLQYESFDLNGGTLAWPKLGLKQAEKAQACATVAQLVLEAVRQESGIGDLDFDKDGDIGVRYGSVLVWIRLVGSPKHVRIYSPLVGGVEETPALLARLNEINAAMAHPHFFFRDDHIGAVTEVPAEPFEPAHLVHALREFCQLTDGIDELLQAEFGGETTFVDAMPSISKH